MEHQEDIKIYCVEKWDFKGVWTGFMWFRTGANGGLFCI